MKRSLLIIGSVSVIMPVVIVILGGLNFRFEMKYFGSDRSVGHSPSIYLQNTILGGWGTSEFVSYAKFGAPYALYIYESLPVDTGTTRFEIEELRVVADGKVAFEKWNLPLDLVAETTRQGGVWRDSVGFTASWEGLLVESPERVTVSGMLVRSTDKGSEPLPFSSEFHLVRIRQFSLGARTFAY